MPFQGAPDFPQDGGVVDGGWHGPLIAVGDLFHGAAQNLAGSRLRQPRHRDVDLERGHRADLFAYQRHDFLLDLGGWAVDPGLEHDETTRRLTLELVLHSDDGAFGNIRVRGQHFLHATGGKTVASDVDDVVGAAHDVEIAVAVLEAGVRCLVVARDLGEIAFPHAIGMLPQGRHAPGRQWQLDHDRSHAVRRDLPAGLIDDANVVARHPDGG